MLTKEILTYYKTLWITGNQSKIRNSELEEVYKIVKKHPSNGKDATTRIIDALDAELVEQYRGRK